MGPAADSEPPPPGSVTAYGPGRPPKPANDTHVLSSEYESPVVCRNVRLPFLKRMNISVGTLTLGVCINEDDRCFKQKCFGKITEKGMNARMPFSIVSILSMIDVKEVCMRFNKEHSVYTLEL